MAPLDTSSIHPVKTNFELICSLKSNGLIPVNKYRSSRTGLTVVIASVEGPIVKGYFTLATELFDDDGLPHTLEHLIFLGSEQYPYKGVLDLLANRCLASGTNAWTDSDHTCYTMVTAGSEGFLSLMPIYVDHILYPLLKESGFITEVHHISGEGENAGIVYSEMQGRENLGESLAYGAMKKAVYPGTCGYRYEEGGIMKNLRESCSNEKVLNYHKKFYRPENLCLIIAGQVKPDDVFAALTPIENKILSKGERGSFDRPWQTPLPQFSESVDQEVLYPCDDEDHGLVFIGWRGPSAVSDLYGITACSLLMKYLTDTSASPLQKEFVENDDPTANDVSYSLAENSESMIYISFSNVPVDKLDSVKSKLDSLLKKIVSGEEDLDMDRMSTVVHRHRQEILSHLESNPHDSLGFMIIGDLLYGNTKDDLHQRLNASEILDQLAKESKAFWLQLLKKWLVDNRSATIRGRPSLAERQRLTDEEQKRIEDQKEGLGADGLAKHAKVLQEAIAHNEIPPPDSMLKSVPIPGTSSMNFHSLEHFDSESERAHANFPLKDVPFYVRLDNVHSNFVYCFALMDTSGLSAELRPYLQLFVEALLGSNVMQHGKELIPYDDVVKDLERDTVSYNAQLGVVQGDRFKCGMFSHTASLKLKCEPSKFKRAVHWIHHLLYRTVFTADRLKIIANKMVYDVATLKRSGPVVVKELMAGIRYIRESNNHNNSFLRQQKFLMDVIEKLSSESTAQSVIDNLEKVRKTISWPLTLHLAANLDTLPSHLNGEDPTSILSQIPLDSFEHSVVKLPVTPDWKLILSPSETLHKSCVLGLGSVDSAYLIQNVPCVNNPLDADLPAILVLLQYLSQLEGPMWKRIRGQGYSYSYSLMCDVVKGSLSLTLYRATNVVAAYREAVAILGDHSKSDAEFDETLLESARSSLVFHIISEEQCSVSCVVVQSLINYFKGVDHKYNSNLVKQIMQVTSEDMAKVSPKYIGQLLESDSTRTTLVVHSSKAAEMETAFKKMGVKLSVCPSMEESYLLP